MVHVKRRREPVLIRAFGMAWNSVSDDALVFLCSTPVTAVGTYLWGVGLGSVERLPNVRECTDEHDAQCGHANAYYGDVDFDGGPDDDVVPGLLAIPAVPEVVDRLTLKDGCEAKCGSVEECEDHRVLEQSLCDLLRKDAQKEDQHSKLDERDLENVQDFHDV
ncbi:hypothetical protein OPT61_g2198 [Boeremia exigua]|uniref:Uncharacterized protein n=1 Tax=Boeremia exigua TaxID=749465 RepID=A0ACC2IMJ6_9PLEO|nr:hypothetical protein OPT61_g2198 [Boeremia exigua]